MISKGIIFTTLAIITAVSSENKNGRKVIFSNATSMDESFKYSTEPEPKVGTQEYYTSFQWVSVTSDGYEYEGSLADVMSYLGDESDDDFADSLRMYSHMNSFEDEAESPAPKPDFAEAHHMDDNFDEDYFMHNLHQQAVTGEQLLDPSETPDKKNRNFMRAIEEEGAGYDPSSDDEKLLSAYGSEDDDNAMDHLVSTTELMADEEEEGYDPSETPDKKNTFLDMIESRDKRRVFYPDNRRRVAHFRFPYTAIGRVDIGCTGTFIARRTILTAARCVHSGGRRGRWYRHLNFGRCKKCNPNQGWRHTWKRAVIFRGWMTRRWLRYDVAVILVYQPSPVFMYVKHSNRVYSGIINIAGYPRGKGGCLYRTHCRMRVRYRRPYLLRYRCDTSSGMVGSAIYKYWSRRNRRLIQGVHTLSGRRRNIGTHLSWWHVRRIRRWIRIYRGN